ncbi:hypothetical protein H1Q63_31065 [Desmonostoc muscorum CCALA 125]|nr:hypothetical protein [Desmonostoc muscorum CCALA 125]
MDADYSVSKAETAIALQRHNKSQKVSKTNYPVRGLKPLAKGYKWEGFWVSKLNYPPRGLIIKRTDAIA